MAAQQSSTFSSLSGQISALIAKADSCEILIDRAALQSLHMRAVQLEHERDTFAASVKHIAMENGPDCSKQEASSWIEGVPALVTDVAWLRVSYHDGAVAVILGVRDPEDRWCEADGWRGDANGDYIDGDITHWQPYVMPEAALLPQQEKTAPHSLPVPACGNEYGLDLPYHVRWLNRVLPALDRFTPQEFAVEFGRMARAADPEALLMELLGTIEHEPTTECLVAGMKHQIANLLHYDRQSEEHFDLWWEKHYSERRLPQEMQKLVMAAFGSARPDYFDGYADGADSTKAAAVQGQQRAGHGLQVLQIGRTVDELEAEAWPFIEEQAANVRSCHGRIERYAYELANGGVIALWDGDQLHALSVTLRDSFNRTVCVKMAKQSRETTATQGVVDESKFVTE